MGQNLITVLDVGSTKLSCVIARAEAGGAIRVLGLGHHYNQAVELGRITNEAALEHGVRVVLDKAERMAGLKVEDVWVTTALGNQSADVVSVDVAVGGHAVEAADVENVYDAARAHPLNPDRRLLHMSPACYSLDGRFGVTDPIGEIAEMLGLDMHLVTAERSTIDIIETMVRSAHVDVKMIIATAQAASLGATKPEERETGVAVVEIGGGATGISVFCHNALAHLSYHPIGGVSVTRDISTALRLPVTQAERLKTLYGNVLHCPADHRECIDLSEGGAGKSSFPKSVLTGIIRPRMEELLEAVRADLQQVGFFALGQARRPRLVLTGGGTQLPGVQHLAEQLFPCSVRIGYPMGLVGLADAMAGPAFSALAGAFPFIDQQPEEREVWTSPLPPNLAMRPLSRVSRWFRNHF
ncbi:MAG: cell division protein FtsA [Pseudomonadota bacterium]